MSAAIRFENISKRYGIGVQSGNFRELLASIPKNLLKRGAKSNKREFFWALKDVSFEVERGKVLGIIGPNCAGKTTTLKLMSRVTKPTFGSIDVDGRLSALIELGAGFHPELTGIENIYLNGIILGLSKKEIDRKLDSIVEFAELEKFIYTPVKYYSSGMYARLGFSVAAHVDPDILLVDEVLSVGDEAFQIKCHNYIHSLVRGGRTSIFVSHNLYAIEQLCDRVIWLDRGQIIQAGHPSTVLRSYMDETDRRLSQQNANEGGDEGETKLLDSGLKIHQFEIMDTTGVVRENFFTNEDIQVKIDYETNGSVERPFFCLWISEGQSAVPIIAANMLLDDFVVPDTRGHSTLTCLFRNIPLMPRTYNIWLEIYGKDRSQLLYKWRVLGSFRIIDEDSLTKKTKDDRGQVRFSRAHAAVKIPYEWKLQENMRIKG